MKLWRKISSLWFLFLGWLGISSCSSLQGPRQSDIKCMYGPPPTSHWDEPVDMYGIPRAEYEEVEELMEQTGEAENSSSTAEKQTEDAQ